ncbi:hypothetical protein SAMN05216548_10515 [Faunimonas pinastri]|uniref:Uncharacterized protein n=1 Tax=Faunimonas pinastri TaxID=1855383 RepID=A0A1H9GEQ8_9HYPH|nr:hypothetical protein [Faunimonas pinastri]SEQ48523.1 hypothetical protein SAMN05216548_10515 [Faunimonas pinastri]
MAKTTIIKLHDPLVGHDGPIHRVVLREPTVSDVLEFGDPVAVGRTPSGTMIYAENLEAIRGYVERCLVEPKDHLILEMGGIRLARDLKQAVIDFFQSDDEDNAASKTSPSTSPSPE